MLDLTEQRRGRGVASERKVERVRLQLDGTCSRLAPVEARTTEWLDELAVRPRLR